MDKVIADIDAQRRGQSFAPGTLSTTSPRPSPPRRGGEGDEDMRSEYSIRHSSFLPALVFYVLHGMLWVAHER